MHLISMSFLFNIFLKQGVHSLPWSLELIAFNICRLLNFKLMKLSIRKKMKERNNTMHWERMTIFNACLITNV